MVTFDRSFMPCMDAVHYCVNCDAGTTVGQILDAAVEQVIDPYRTGSGFEPNSIRFKVTCMYGGDWINPSNKMEFQDDEFGNSVVPDNIRSLRGTCQDFTHWGRYGVFTIMILMEDPK